MKKRMLQQEGKHRHAHQNGQVLLEGTPQLRGGDDGGCGQRHRQGVPRGPGKRGKHLKAKAS